MNLKEALHLEVFEVVAVAARELNVSAYVIGGYVRDHLLHRPLKGDIDFVTEGDGIALAQKVSDLLPNQPKVAVFKRYGTAMLQYQDLQLEFVGARKESYSPDSRNPAVEQGSLQDDQNRRDFTINALAISLNEADYGKLIDPFGGLLDLEHKIIRTPLDPGITYSDDPLRMLRAIRFAGQLSFKIEAASFKAIEHNKERMSILSMERVSEELNKMMLCSQPSQSFLLLEESGLLQYILPELTALKGVEEKEGHLHKDNFRHTLEVLDNISEKTDHLWLRWAALLHDIGKAPTKKFDPPTGWTFHMHEFIGAKMVRRVFKRLKLPLNEPLNYVQKMVRLSSRPIALVSDEVSDSALRRLLHEAGDDFEDLMTLCRADITTKNPKRKERYIRNFDYVEEKAIKLEERDHIRNFQPPIDGETIMKTFDLKPGKEVGEIKNQIKEAILEGEIENNYDQAFAFMLKLAQKMNI